MNTEILKKEQFETLKELSELTVKISEAREELLKIEQTKDEYIEKREKETVDKIQEVFDKSEDLLSKIKKNNEEIHTLYRVVSSYKDFLSEGHETFTKLITEFNERSELWDKRVENQYSEFGRIENEIKQEKQEIEKGRKKIEEDTEEIKKEKIKIKDAREVIKRQIERLKANKK